MIVIVHERWENETENFQNWDKVYMKEEYGITVRYK